MLTKAIYSHPATLGLLPRLLCAHSPVPGLATYHNQHNDHVYLFITCSQNFHFIPSFCSFFFLLGLGSLKFVDMLFAFANSAVKSLRQTTPRVRVFLISKNAYSSQVSLVIENIFFYFANKTFPG